MGLPHASPIRAPRTKKHEGRAGRASPTKGEQAVASAVSKSKSLGQKRRAELEQCSYLWDDAAFPGANSGTVWLVYAFYTYM